MCSPVMFSQPYKPKALPTSAEAHMERCFHTKEFMCVRVCLCAHMLPTELLSTGRLQNQSALASKRILVLRFTDKDEINWRVFMLHS